VSLWRTDRLQLFVATDAVVVQRHRFAFGRQRPSERPVVVPYSSADALELALTEGMRAACSRDGDTVSSAALDVIVSHAFVEFAQLPQQTAGRRRLDRSQDELAQASFARLYGTAARSITSFEPSSHAAAIACALRTPWLTSLMRALHASSAPRVTSLQVQPWVTRAYTALHAELPEEGWAVWLEPQCALLLGCDAGNVAYWQSIPTDDLHEIAAHIQRIELRRHVDQPDAIKVPTVVLTSLLAAATGGGTNDQLVCDTMRFQRSSVFPSSMNAAAHWSLPLFGGVYP
jgi:hypothetical protein